MTSTSRRAALAVLTLVLWARGPLADFRDLSVEEAVTPDRFAAQVPREAAWSPKGDRLYFLEPDPSGAEGDLVGLDPTTLSRRKVLSQEAFLAATGSDKKLMSFDLSPSGAHALVEAKGWWVLNLATGTLRRLLPEAEEAENPEWSPDGSLVAYANRRGLWVVDLAGGPPRNLAPSPSEKVLVGRGDWLYGEELDFESGILWSPDGRRIAYWVFDEAEVPTFPMVDARSIHPQVEPQFYPRPGDANPRVRLRVAEVASGVSTEVAGADSGDGYLPRAAWSPDGSALTFVLLDRRQKRLRLLLSDLSGASPRTVLEETSASWINFIGPPRFLSDGKRFLWMSERDGFAHLYLGRLDGGDLVQITRGNWVVDDLLAVDEARGHLYFSGNREDPTGRQVYRTDLSGSPPLLLTDGKGWHEAEVSPDGAWFLDLHSRRGVPPRADLVPTRGGSATVLYENAEPALAEFGFVTPEPILLKALDGTTLHGRLSRPRDFDPAKRYPAIVDVYGGPHAQMVQDRWVARWEAIGHLFAQRGFVVFSLDNRGSWRRGAAFEAAVAGSLGRIELEDQLAGVAYLRSLPFVDPERIGIWGWSYGGFMTLYALTHAPSGTFRAGVAVAPVSDWAAYDSCYTERYLGLPAENPEGYRESSPVYAAAALSGRLLMMHGLSDDNVHFQNSVRMAEALLKEGRPFETAYYPGQNHGIRERTHRRDLFERMLAFFEEALAPVPPR
ncbi:MAG: DPP IV N-terminal domain-containing protein [Acidobacteriota bacterium]